jgi:hypothetical protein
MDLGGHCECEGWIGCWPYHGRNDPPDVFRCSDCERIIAEKFVPESQLQGAVEACERWREWEQRAANTDEPELWRAFAVAMDELCTRLGGQ